MLLWALFPRSDAGKIFASAANAGADASRVNHAAHPTL